MLKPDSPDPSSNARQKAIVLARGPATSEKQSVVLSSNPYRRDEISLLFARNGSERDVDLEISHGRARLALHSGDGYQKQVIASNVIITKMLAKTILQW